MLLGASFQSYWWIQTGVTVSKHPFWVKIGEVFPCVTLKFDGWRWKTIGYLFCATSSFAHHFVAKRWIQTWVTVQKLSIPKKIVNFFVTCDLETSQMTLKNNRAPLLYYFKLCESFHSHWVEIGDFFVPLDLEIWQMTLENNKALSYATSCFVYHFIAQCEIKLELLFGNR